MTGVPSTTGGSVEIGCWLVVAVGEGVGDGLGVEVADAVGVALGLAVAVREGLGATT
jgi:hypothetical protein